MYWHYRVILSELVNNTMKSYTSISNAAVGNKNCSSNEFMRIYLSNLTNFMHKIFVLQ